MIRLVALMYVRFPLARNPRAKVPALFRIAACVGAEKDDIAVCRCGTRTIQESSGAAYRTRTCDPRSTNAMLYQLS